MVGLHSIPFIWRSKHAEKFIPQKRSHSHAGFRISLFRYQLHGLGIVRPDDAVHRRTDRHVGHAEGLADGRPATRRIILPPGIGTSGGQDWGTSRRAHWAIADHGAAHFRMALRYPFMAVLS